MWKLQLLSLKQIVNSSGLLQPQTLIRAAGPLQVALVTSRLFLGADPCQREEVVAKPLPRDVELVLGEQCVPKWQKIVRL